MPDASSRSDDNNASISQDIEIAFVEQGKYADRVIRLNIDSLIPNRFQPRSDFAAEGLAELAASIRAEGIMQPVLVRPGSDSGATGGRYELIAGERRWRAAKLAGLETVPAIVRDLSDESSAEWALIENVHRQDLNAMERAEAMAALLSRFGMSRTALAEKLGFERPTVANLVRLVELEPAIRELIASGRLGAGHGKALLSVPEGPARVTLGESAAAGAWSVRRLEREARAIKDRAGGTNAVEPAVSQRKAVHESMERKLSDHLGTKVRIATSAASGKGKIEIAFFDLDHFDGLMRTLGLPDETASNGSLGS
ncbi:MAG: ParB/RepB/Spo0J family partition protein [Planctomycetota bacterium]